MKPNFDTSDILRKVRVGEYILTTYYLGSPTIGFTFGKPDAEPLFANKITFNSGSVDSDESLRSIMSFVSIEEGDVDPFYFKDYTPEQTAFRDTESENYSDYAMPENRPYDQDLEVLDLLTKPYGI